MKHKKQSTLKNRLEVIRASSSSRNLYIRVKTGQTRFATIAEINLTNSNLPDVYAYIEVLTAFGFAKRINNGVI